jgi:hypothetical protein
MNFFDFDLIQEVDQSSYVCNSYVNHFVDVSTLTTEDHIGIYLT